MTTKDFMRRGDWVNIPVKVLEIKNRILLYSS